jgi:hypothetical protein
LSKSLINRKLISKYPRQKWRISQGFLQVIFQKYNTQNLVKTLTPRTFINITQYCIYINVLMNIYDSASILRNVWYFGDLLWWNWGYLTVSPFLRDHVIYLCSSNLSSDLIILIEFFLKLQHWPISQILWFYFFLIFSRIRTKYITSILISYHFNEISAHRRNFDIQNSFIFTYSKMNKD